MGGSPDAHRPVGAMSAPRGRSTFRAFSVAPSNGLPDPMIELTDLHKTFASKTGPVRAVNGVSLRAEDGQITGLLGPNGAGKTTTLRMLYTLMAPDSGTVAVDGFDSVREAEDVRRRLGVLPDARGVYKRLTARENIAYFGRLHGMSEADVARRTAELSQALGMEDV